MSPRAVSTERSRLPAGLSRFLTTLVVGLRMNASDCQKRGERAKRVETATAQLAAAQVLASIAESLDAARRAVECE